MFNAAHAWLVAGSPAHVYLVLAAAYAGACWILSKLPKARANTVLEVIFNTINPRVLPIVRLIPMFGPLLAGFLDLWDSPKPAAEAAEAPAVRARSNTGRVNVAALLWLCAFLGLGGMFAACMSGCASGADGLRQACANTDTLLTSGYKTATAGMKIAIEAGKAPRLLTCFVDLLAGLDAVKSASDGVCEVVTTDKASAALVAGILTNAASVGNAVAKFQTCSAGVL